MDWPLWRNSGTTPEYAHHGLTLFAAFKLVLSLTEVKQHLRDEEARFGNTLMRIRMGTAIEAVCDLLYDRIAHLNPAETNFLAQNRLYLGATVRKCK